MQSGLLRNPLPTYLLSPRCRILFEKLTVTHFVKQLPNLFYGTQFFITVFTKAGTGFYPEPAEFSSPNRSLSPEGPS
jgi:hypothetical protein